MPTLKPLEDLTFINAYLPITKKGGSKVYGLQGISKKAGVYFIMEDGALVYVGMSRSCVQKALYRHFQHWVSWRQRRVTYKFNLGTNKYTVACITTTIDEAHPIEKAYILHYNPRDNFDRYEEYLRQTQINTSEPIEVHGGIIHEQYEGAALPF